MLKYDGNDRKQYYMYIYIAFAIKIRTRPDIYISEPKCISNVTLNYAKSRMRPGAASSRALF